MVIIIPARLASSRLANKVMLNFGNEPMFVRTAKQAINLARVVIATDSQVVLDAAKKHNLEAILTSSKHQSGSERLAEASCLLGLDDNELIVNLQADEPFFGRENLKQFCEFAEQNVGKYFMASAYSISKEPGDFNKVKVVCSLDNYALYFSREAIAHFRDDYAKDRSWKHHIGIYAYTKASLLEFVKLPSELEHIEKLEQLRVLENNKRILMCELNSNGFGIDSQDDYERALKLLSDQI